MNGKKGFLIPVFIIVGFMIGLLLIGNIDLFSSVPIMVGVILCLFLLEFVKRKMKNSDEPQFDERVFRNIKAYMVGTVVIAFIILFFILVIRQYYLGNNYIEINHLFLFLLLTIMVAGMAGLIGKYKNN